MYYRKSIAILFLALIVGKSTSLGREDTSALKDDKSHLRIALSLSNRYLVPGDTVWFTLSIMNDSQDTLRMTLPTPLAVRFTVYRQQRPVWRSDYGMMFAQVITPFAIAPGDSIPLRAFWLGKDNQAQWLPLGKYFVKGCFTGSNNCEMDSLWLVD